MKHLLVLLLLAALVWIIAQMDSIVTIRIFAALLVGASAAWIVITIFTRR